MKVKSISIKDIKSTGKTRYSSTYITLEIIVDPKIDNNMEELHKIKNLKLKGTDDIVFLMEQYLSSGEYEFEELNRFFTSPTGIVLGLTDDRYEIKTICTELAEIFSF